jgi:hypothetical protein
LIGRAGLSHFTVHADA